VEDPFDSVKRFLDRMGIVDVPVNELDLILHFRDVLAVACAQIIKHPNTVASLQEPSHNMRPNKSTTTGD
jgi:hypothetical protein